MSLPFPSKVFTPFDQLPASDLNEMVANDEALAAGTGFNDNVITYAKLLSTIFSGNITTAANSGTWGGTNYYVNLGGIKLLWGVSDVATVNSGTDKELTVIFPASFFGTVLIPTVNTISNNVSYGTQLLSTIKSYSTSTNTLSVHNFGGGASGNIKISWLFIGI